MTSDDRMVAVLTDWLEDQPSRAPAPLLDVVLTDLQQMPQRTRWRIARLRWSFLPWKTLAPAALVVALAAVIAVALWANENRAVVPGGTPVATLTPTDRAEASPSPVPTPSFAVAPVGDLSWSKVDVSAIGLAARPFRDPSITRVQWIDDRFVLADERLGTVVTSPDGLSWEHQEDGSPDFDYYPALIADSVQVWQDQVVGWSSSTVTLARREAAPIEHEFEGIVGTAGIGPRGIIVAAQSTLDFDAYITSLIGPGWVEHMTGFSFTDGVLRITTDDDRDLELVWADTGYEPGDVAGRGFGWLSVDGVEWTPIPNFPDNVSEIVGTRDGFLARGSSMWTSVDGLAWRNLGPFEQGTVVAWQDGALLVPNGAGDFRESQAWTFAGTQPLASAPPRVPAWTSTGVGPLGLIAMRSDESIVYTFDATEWTTLPIPEEMGADGKGFTAPTVAVGRESVAALVWKEEPDGSHTPSLWLAAFEQ